MNNFHKNPRFQAAALLVVIAALVWFVFYKPAQKAVAPATNENSQNSANPQAISPGQQTDTGNNILGVLQISDNLKKGNLMLIMPGRVLYIYTSRDFSGLLGKQVTMTYDGTLDNFRLIDLIEK